MIVQQLHLNFLDRKFHLYQFLMINLHRILVLITVALFMLGRICDDLAWYLWEGISTNTLEAMSMASLASSAIITVVRRSYEEGVKNFLFKSQVKFVIPWSLATLMIILIFNIFGCYSELSSNADFYLDYSGCWVYSAVILLSNLNYSVNCGIQGGLSAIFFYEMVLFAEIIYNGSLLTIFIDQLTGEHKDYSILYVTIFITWQMLTMDILFRAANENQEIAEKHQELHKLIMQHNCQNIQKKDIPDSCRPLELKAKQQETNCNLQTRITLKNNAHQELQ